jgi:uncharacterized glyoxalase superfamily protein PhnB
MPDAAPHSKSTVIPALRYLDAKAAIEWLSNVFGFERHAVYEMPDGSIAHAELTLNGGMIMLGSQKDDEHGRRFKSPAELGDIETRSAYIVVADAEAAYARAQAAGAERNIHAQPLMGSRLRARAGRRSHYHPPDPEHRLRQPRVRGRGSGRPFVERGNIRSLAAALLTRISHNPAQAAVFSPARCS